MNKAELLRRIQELSFACVESELFLDTHPDCMAALDFFKKTKAELEMATEEYENKYGPLTAKGVMGGKWSWIDGPWPWQVEWDRTENPTGRKAEK